MAVPPRFSTRARARGTCPKPLPPKIVATRRGEEYRMRAPKLKMSAYIGTALEAPSYCVEYVGTASDLGTHRLAYCVELLRTERPR